MIASASKLNTASWRRLACWLKRTGTHGHGGGSREASCPVYVCFRRKLRHIITDSFVAAFAKRQGELCSRLPRRNWFEYVTANVSRPTPIFGVLSPLAQTKNES